MVWNAIEKLSSLLDEDERQAVRGDIQERGADARALLSLLGLVLLRQLQAWKAWQTWALAAALYYPARSAGFNTHPIPDILYSGHWFYYQRAWGGRIIQPWDIMAAVVYAWAIGFSLARFGHRRAASVLLLLPLAFTSQVQSIARSIFFDRDIPRTDYSAFMGLAAASLAYLDHSAYVLALCLMMALVVFPCLLGFRRGLNAQPLSRAAVVLLLAACSISLFELFRPVVIGASTWRWPRTAASLWPLVYVVATSRASYVLRTVMTQSR